VQTIKAVEIDLGHLKTHRATARRLQAAIQKDTKQERTLVTKQQELSKQSDQCALVAAPDPTAFLLHNASVTRLPSCAKGGYASTASLCESVTQSQHLPVRSGPSSCPTRAAVVFLFQFVAPRRLRAELEAMQARVDAHAAAREAAQRAAVTLSMKREEAARLRQAVPEEYWQAEASAVELQAQIEQVRAAP
jgi:hypothetical protein